MTVSSIPAESNRELETKDLYFLTSFLILQFSFIHFLTATMSGNTTTNSSSTLKAYVDSATGAVQNLVGNVVGSPGEQVRRSRNCSSTHS